jgi:anti-sigma factor RsiW
MTEQPHTHLTCQQVADLIVDYVAGDMSAAIQATFKAHLRNCPDCTAFLNTYRETIRTTRALHHEDVPEEMFKRVQDFLHERIKENSPGR